MPAVAGDAVQKDDPRSPLVAPRVKVKPSTHRTVPRRRREQTGPGPRPQMGGASPPDCTLPGIA